MWGRDDDGQLFWATVVFAPFPKLLDGTERYHRPLMSTQSPCRCPSKPDSAQALELPTCSAPARPSSPLISREAGLPPPVCSSMGLPKPRFPPSGFPAASHHIQNSTTLGRRVPIWDQEKYRIVVYKWIRHCRNLSKCFQCFQTYFLVMSFMAICCLLIIKGYIHHPVPAPPLSRQRAPGKWGALTQGGVRDEALWCGQKMF